MNKGITYGLYTALGLIFYFLIMKVIGQETNVWLRLFNFFILAAGVYQLFKKMYRGNHVHYSYFDGLKMGVVLTVTAVAVFVIFLALYVEFVDPAFISIMENSQIWGNQLTIEEAGFAILIEGLASGVIISFAWMQHFKKNFSDTKAV
jgi:hypothetical protein